MKTAKREAGSTSIDNISNLPCGILQRILYLLSQEEAVRTSVLSKSWRYIWCTRPNLDFSDDAFKGNKQEFLSVVSNTLQRYCDQSLCVEEFGLCISLGDSNQEFFFSHLERWIPTLRSIGMKKFCLSISSKHCGTRPKLPSVVFEAESLHELHVKMLELDKNAIQRIVVFKNLKTLRLQRVTIEDEIFQTVISCCPLIETLDVQECETLTSINVSHHHNLKNFTFRKHELCSIEIHTPSIQTIDVDYGSLWFHKGADFRNLNVLSFSLANSPLHHLSSCKFPSLQSLKFMYCDGLRGIQLFIDAPNINRFEYVGLFVPTISFATTSNEWVSRIDLTYRQYWNDPPPSSLWFLKLKELLNSVRRSKISLILRNNHYEMKFQKNIVVQDSGCDNAVVVESLRIRCSFFNFPSLLNSALSICRPRNIGMYDLRSEINDIDCLRKILMQRESRDQLNQLRELEEASMEVYNYNREEWHPITLSELPMYDEETKYVLIRFVLKWRENYV